MHRNPRWKPLSTSSWRGINTKWYYEPTDTVVIRVNEYGVMGAWAGIAVSTIYGHLYSSDNHWKSDHTKNAMDKWWNTFGRRIEKIISTVPERMWRCEHYGFENTAYDFTYYPASELEWRGSPFKIWHDEDRGLVEHPPGFYCPVCLLEAEEKADTTLWNILESGNPENIQLPEEPIYPCKSCVGEDEEFEMPHEVFWYSGGDGQSGFYCHNCLHNFMVAENEIGPDINTVIRWVEHASTRRNTMGQLARRVC